MITSVSRIMASNYRNNTKPNNTAHFKGPISRKIARETAENMSIQDAILAPDKGFFSSLLSTLNPLNHIGSALGKSSGSEKLR